MHSTNFVCIPCRYTAKHGRGVFLCPFCNVELIDAGAKWRPPKKTNDKAWESMRAAPYIQPKSVAGLPWLIYYPGRRELLNWEGTKHKRFCRCTECRPVKTKEKPRSSIPQYRKYGGYDS